MTYLIRHHYICDTLFLCIFLHRQVIRACIPNLSLLPEKQNCKLTFNMLLTKQIAPVCFWPSHVSFYNPQESRISCHITYSATALSSFADITHRGMRGALDNFSHTVFLHLLQDGCFFIQNSES